MRPFLEGWVGDPVARHRPGEEARESLAIEGVALRGPGRHVVTTAIEHPSLLAPCRDLGQAGFEMTALGATGTGVCRPTTCAGRSGSTRVR